MKRLQGFNVLKPVVSAKQQEQRQKLEELFTRCPIPQDELLRNLGLFLKPADLKKVLFIHDLYQRIVEVHGIIIEFGVRWGQNLALFQALRSIYEPYNYNRRIVGFDTFAGFPSVHAKDGKHKVAALGSYAVTERYEDYLDELLRCQEAESALDHMKKFELVRGDASKEIGVFLKSNPETIVALAYFDMDVYEPTKKCLKAITPHLTKGSVVGFDELNCHAFPGETVALRETWGLSRLAIKRSKYSHLQSFAVYE